MSKTREMMELWESKQVSVGDWITVVRIDTDGLDIYGDFSDENPKYLYEVGSGGKVIYVDDGMPLVEFYWGKYIYQQDTYKEQAMTYDCPDAEGGWFVDKNCLTVLPKGLTIKEMQALSKLFKESNDE